MAILQSGATADLLTIDPISKAARQILFDSAANPLHKADKAPSGITPGTTAGLPLVGANRITPRLVRSMSDGALADGRPMICFSDAIEGAAVNTNLWVQTLTTMTITQGTGTILFNAGASFATTVGALQTAQHQVPLPGRARIIFRTRQRHTQHYNNNLIELGFANATSATTTLQVQGATGAVWQKDGSGQYIPSLFVAGTLIAGTPISNAAFVSQVPATDYAVFEIEVDEYGAWFRILTSAGVLVTGSEQRIDFGVTIGDWSVTHFTPMVRTYNSAATGTAVQVYVGQTDVYLLDIQHNKPWNHQLAGMGYSWVQNPVTTFAQLANYVNITAPTTRTPTNTTALEPTLGGHVSWNNAGTSFAGDDTKDWILFGWQNPTPYAFYLTGSRISTVNLGAANGATAYTIEYALQANGVAVTLVGATNRFIPLGFQTLAAAGAIGAVFDRDTVWNPGTPVAIQPGRYIHLVGRVIVGTATSAQVIRTLWTPDGYFE
jgi:hypothetical protein